jgi:hypothetical protein
MLVTIRGSKPSPLPPTSDAIYYCNAAVAETLAARAASTIVHVATRYFFSPVRLTNVNLARRDSIRGVSVNKTVVFGKYDSYVEQSQLDLLSYTTEAIEPVGVGKRNALIRSFYGSLFPLSAVVSGDGTVGRRFSNVARILRMKDVENPYRPSTGLLALLVSIRDFGANATYVVSGIGINTSGYFIDGRKYDAPRNHLDFDRRLLARLSASNLDIRTTESELAHDFGLSLV